MTDFGKGSPEQRVSHRRYPYDRRSEERRRQYWRNLLTPILVGILMTSVISWGIYVTHLSYSLNAKYEQVFIKYMADETLKEAASNHRLEMISEDYNRKLVVMHADFTRAIAETRSAIRDLYNLLLRQPTAIQVGPEAIEDAPATFLPSEEAEIE